MQDKPGTSPFPATAGNEHGTPAASPGEAGVAEAWARIRGRLREEVGEVEYRTWMRQMTLAAIEGDEAVVQVPSRFLRDWVRSQYGDRLRALWMAENLGVRRVEIRVSAPSAEEGADAARAEAVPAMGLTEPLAARPAEPRPESRLAETRAEAKADARNDWSAPLDPRYTFESFVVGKPNEFAHACARRVSEKPASPGFNPLFLYGGVGLGKTHLMHAIAWALREARPDCSVAYMSAEKFMYRFIAALRSQSTMEFKESLRSVDVLMIDDLQFLIGKDNTQEEFFHTFNALVDAGKQIIVSADKSPSDLSGLEDRLRTRLGCGMVADIHATTYELRISILEAKAASAGTAVPARVLEYLAHKITSNVRELEGALNRLVAHANLFGRPVTLESCQEVLHDILRAHDRRVTIEEIQKRVAEHYNMRLTDMSSARRARNVARPRQVAMYLAKQLTSRSLPEIGRKFGNRDHTTVMHAVAKVAELMQQDSGFAEDVELLRRMLET
ncbi:chromosomal replication initiator protein DnaA [Roseomonas sp. OT10]|uniref:chromosomal replication initiator protein DnaA n=1 Tax=Roseomonas cutis TaxID=2897332 RepID=UPI001E3A5D4E|nr:chromosomal replication initiator protein DnaA [Roseomonas sp. OT10]UFN47666.1 chromosomal replication initiator protein DnaA [Roseomonas sp. OT10]